VNVYSISSIIASVFTFLLSIFVLIKGRQSRVNRSFSAITLSVSIWSLFPFLASVAENNSQAIYFAQFVYMAAAFTPSTFLHFILEFIGKRDNLDRIVLRLSYAVSVFFLVFSHNQFFIKGVARFLPYFAVIPGPLYLIFALFFGVIGAYAFLKLIVTYNASTGYKRAQYRYIFVAFVVAYVSGLMHFSPAYKIPEIIPHDLLIVIFSFIITYAILSVRLMDIEFVIKRSFVYSVLTGLIIGVYTLIIFVSQELFANLIGLRWLLILIGSSMIAVGFKPLETAFTNFSDKYFFQGKYDYHKVLKDLSRGMAELTSLERLTKLITRIVMKNVKLEGSMLFVYDYNANTFRAVAAQGDMKEFKDAELAKTDNLVKYMDEKGDVLIKGEVAHEMENDQSLDTHRNFLRSILKQMNRFKAVLCVPSKIGDKLMGFILLSEKKSRDAYSTEDLMLFQTLAPQAAIAIKNAMTYDEIRKEFEKEHEKVATIEKQLERSARLASLGTVAAGVAHEIRNPLGMIQLKTDKLAIDQLNEESLKEFKASVTSNIERSTNIIRNMLDLAKSKDKVYSNVNLVGVIESALQFFPLSGIKLVKELLPVPDINGNAEELKQVFVNLIDNAVKAMPNGGTLKIASRHEDNNVNIYVTDTGVGIPKEDFERIFDPFYSTRHEGTGLGLSITYRIVREHGASIRVESEVGKGSTFQLQFTAV
jgi:signal transduction histidine kinase